MVRNAMQKAFCNAEYKIVRKGYTEYFLGRCVWSSSGAHVVLQFSSVVIVLEYRYFCVSGNDQMMTRARRPAIASTSAKGQKSQGHAVHMMNPALVLWTGTVMELEVVLGTMVAELIEIVKTVKDF